MPMLWQLKSHSHERRPIFLPEPRREIGHGPLKIEVRTIRKAD
jgi:hypothetical protein